MINCLRMIVMLSLIGWIALPAQAEQTYTATPEKAITAQIAAKEMSRIYVKGDRIQQVLGPKHAYHLSNDHDDGGIYIQPKGTYRKHLFHVFIKTEQGAHYSLNLNPSKQTATTVALKPKAGVNPKAEHWERHSVYQNTVVNLIQAMVQQRPPEGYEVSKLKEEKACEKCQLDLHYRLQYHGRHLVGRVIQVTNTSSASRTLNESQFYHPGDRALSLARHKVKAHQSTTLYKVSAS